MAKLIAHLPPAAVASPFVVYELVEGVRAAVAEREP
jgi:hypothetical protein